VGKPLTDRSPDRTGDAIQPLATVVLAATGASRLWLSADGDVVASTGADAPAAGVVDLRRPSPWRETVRLSGGGELSIEGRGPIPAGAAALLQAVAPWVALALDRPDLEESARAGVENAVALWIDERARLDRARASAAVAERALVAAELATTVRRLLSSVEEAAHRLATAPPAEVPAASRRLALLAQAGLMELSQRVAELPGDAADLSER
jgi:hypothetical protein